MLRNGGQRASDGCFFSPIFHSRLINLRAFAMALFHAFHPKSINPCLNFVTILFELLQNADARAMLRVTLINEYLCNQPTRSMPDLSHLIMALPLIAFVA